MTADDDDIKDLLEQLDAVEAETDEPVVDVVEDDMPQVITNTTHIPAGLAEQPGQMPTTPSQIIVANQPSDEPGNAAPVAAQPPLEIKRFIDNYLAAHSEVLADCRTDRAETQSVIAALQADIDDIKQNGGGVKAVPRVLIESLVKALEVKANINDTKVKMTDSGAKLIAALRSQININNQQNIIDGSLEDVLTNPLNEGTDDY